MTAYAHNDELLVGRGAHVKRGQIIAKLGGTGGVASPQLHFELRQGGRPIDPASVMGPMGPS
jgi:murein DD-endopeptidase MepM/ murein hydrolase activator NlpD